MGSRQVNPTMSILLAQESAPSHPQTLFTKVVTFEGGGGGLTNPLPANNKPPVPLRIKTKTPSICYNITILGLFNIRG